MEQCGIHGCAYTKGHYGKCDYKEYVFLNFSLDIGSRRGLSTYYVDMTTNITSPNEKVAGRYIRYSELPKKIRWAIKIIRPLYHYIDNYLQTTYPYLKGKE